MPQLNPEFFITQIFWLAIIFTMVFLFVTKYFIPRIGTVVDKRESSVKKRLSDAQKIFEKQKELKEKIEDILEQAREKGGNIRRTVGKDTELELNQNIAKVEKEMTKKLAKAEEMLARQKTQLLSDIEKESEGISQEIIKQIFHNNNLKKKASN